MDKNDFSKGKLYINNKCINITDITWNEHPAYKGVFLKHVIKGENTNNRLSCHLVKIEPGCEIGIHNHVGKTELHEVVNGFGYCMLGQKKLNYQKGVTGIIPADSDHMIKAGDKGLFLLAKFFPALL